MSPKKAPANLKNSHNASREPTHFCDIVPAWKAEESTPVRFQGFLHPHGASACLIVSHEFACPTCRKEAKMRAAMMTEEHGYIASSSYVTFRFTAEHNEFGVRALKICSLGIHYGPVHRCYAYRLRPKSSMSLS